MSRREISLLIFFALFFSAMAVMAGVSRADNSNQIVNQLNIDGDDEAYNTWNEWSWYPDNGSWWQSPDWHHEPINEKTPDGTKLLMFNPYMNHKAEGGGWQHFDSSGTTFNIRNVVKYAVGVTMFNNSAISIYNCREVVLGLGEDIPYKGTRKGYLINTQVVVSNFEKLWIYNFTYTKSGGRPLEIVGNGNSTVVIKALYVHSSTMVKAEGVGIRKVGLLRFNTSHDALLITNHTPALVLEDVKHIRMDPWSDLVINNRYYDVSENKWTKGGVGILTKNVKKIDGDMSIQIYNCDVGIEFENNGTGEALNGTWYVHFHNCTENYAYGGTYTALPAGLDDLILGFQAVTGFLVALAWFRVGVHYVSERREKKEMAKDMMSKAAIGSTIVAIIAYGYYIMLSLVNWIFGG